MLTLDQVRNEIKAIADDQPDYVYECPAADMSVMVGCNYVHRSEDAPGCIIGQWLHYDHGVSLDDLDVYEGCGVRDVLEGVFPEQFNAYTPLTEENQAILTYCSAVQGKQDKGIRWGDAVYVPTTFAEEA